MRGMRKDQVDGDPDDASFGGLRLGRGSETCGEIGMLVAKDKGEVTVWKESTLTSC